MPNRFHVGGRILKTSIAVALSIFVAQQFGLERVTLAAIVAVVTIQRTFYRSLVLSASKLGSVTIGAVLGTLLGTLLGPSPVTYGLVTMAVILCCLWLKWQDNIGITAITAIATISSRAENLTVYSLQQFFAALTGAVVALAVNFLFAPDHRELVEAKLRAVEAGLAHVMDIVAAEMLAPNLLFANFSDFADDLKREAKEGLDMAKLFREEQRFHVTQETQADLYREAFRISLSHLKRLQEMHGLAGRMVCEAPQAIPIARLLRIMAKAQRRQLAGHNLHKKLIDRAISMLEARFERMELPASRAEFLSRSALVHLFYETKTLYVRIQEMPPLLRHDSIIKKWD